MKDDTVSRAAVMKSLTKEYNRRRTGDGLKLAWIEKAVDEVPAVQPKDPENGPASCINPEKMHDRTMDECISRQAVLKSIDDYERLSAVSQTVRNMTSLREIVQQLPSAQPETHDKRTETHACDLISRQAAIDALMKRDKELRNINWYDNPYAEGECRGIDEALAIVSNLPSAQPENRTDKRTGTHVCDLISRQQAIDALSTPHGILYPIRTVEALPSVQPTVHPQRTCVNCGRTVNNGGWYADGRTRCPIEEHYALPKDGYCHLWEKRNVTDDDYPERREE